MWLAQDCDINNLSQLVQALLCISNKMYKSKNTHSPQMSRNRNSIRLSIVKITKKSILNMISQHHSKIHNKLNILLQRPLTQAQDDTILCPLSGMTNRESLTSITHNLELSGTTKKEAQPNIMIHLKQSWCLVLVPIISLKNMMLTLIQRKI